MNCFLPRVPRRTTSLTGWAVFLLLLGTTLTPARPLKVLILSGQNNHDWQATTPRIKAILTNTALFEVDLTNHLEQGDSSSFAKYDALLSNWNAWGQAGVKEWPEKTRAAFLEFVRNGKGLVVVHAGGSSFLDWQEYQDLIGGTWGKETGRGKPHPFTVRIAAPEHPITRGFTSFKITDELWHRMDTRPAKTVLATAFSAKESGGSGRDEPVAFVTQFGKGRCFNLVLGHDLKAMSAPGFQALLARGTEWAATGNVTLPAPSVEDLAGFDAIIRAVANYDPAGPRDSVLELERTVAAASADPASRSSMARRLAETLAGNSATVDGRKVFCWQLSLVGSAEQVPLLSRLLADTNLHYYARLALERIPGEEAGAALRAALETTRGLALAGIIHSLAARGDEWATVELKKIARSTNREAAAAAIAALGRLGGPANWRDLQDLERTVPEELRSTLEQAQLDCAAGLVKTGESQAAVPALEKLFSSTNGQPVIRAAAFQLWATARGEQSAARVLAALKGEDVVLREAAIATLKTAPSSLLAGAARDLEGFPPETAIRFIGILSDRKVQDARVEVTRALTRREPGVRLAAMNALAIIGDEASIQALTPLLTSKDKDESAAVVSVLGRLPGNDVEQVLIRSLSEAAPEVQTGLIRALRSRGSVQSVPELVGILKQGSEPVQVEAARALKDLANPSVCPELISLIDNAPARLVMELESALAGICSRANDVGPLANALNGASATKKISLLNALAGVGGPKAQAAISSQLSETCDSEVCLAALSLLAEWPDAAPMQDLGRVAEKAPDPRARALALRGLARLAPIAGPEESAALLALIERSLPKAVLPEQRAFMSALGSINSPASLKLAAACVAQTGLQEEAKLTVFRILGELPASEREAVRPILEQLKTSLADPADAARLESAALRFTDLVNLSLSATATNLDGLKADGQGGPPSAAIDGKRETYWDEVDNQKLYALRVDLKERSKIGFIRIIGWQHHNHSPRDFELLGDGKSLKQVTGAEYVKNVLEVPLPGPEVRNIELRITGSHGPSPAIRELEIYGTPVKP